MVRHAALSCARDVRRRQASVGTDKQRRRKTNALQEARRMSKLMPCSPVTWKPKGRK